MSLEIVVHDGLGSSRSGNAGIDKQSGDADVNFSDLETLIDSDYDLEDDLDLENLLTERQKEWEKVFALSRSKSQSQCQTEKNTEDNVEEDVEYSDDDYIASSLDEENGAATRLLKYVRFKPEVDMADPKFEVGMIFTNREEFKNACKHHGVKHGRRIRFKKNDKRRVKAICMDCSWMVSTAYRERDDSLHITSLNSTHSCGTTFNHGCANAKYLSRRYREDIRIIPQIRIGEIVQKVYSDMHLNISRTKAQRTKKLAITDIEGDYLQQFSRLYDYCQEVCRANPSSNVFLMTTENDDGDEVFQRLYFCLGACKQGFLAGCRPLVGLDGCHLRGPQKGILLTAVGLDPNDQIFPIAFAIVEIENKDTWKWFLRELKEDLKIQNFSDWTFITDKQKGLINAIYELLPGSEHRLCVWHMLQNLKKVHSGLALKDALMAAARATYVNKFIYHMECLKELNEEAFKWVQRHTSPKHWTRSHFSTTPKCDILVNNICECFNRVLLNAREKPVLSMLESIRYYLMVRMEKKREWMTRFSRKLCPKIQDKLESNKKQSNTCIATHAGELIYEIKCMYGDQFTVDLRKRTCSCRKWELNGIPCAHAISAINRTGEDPEAFVHNYYSRDTYLRVYKHMIYPINGQDMWENVSNSVVVPPENIRLPGRPKKNRKKDPTESISESNIKRLSRAGRMTYKCSHCHGIDHNVRKCPNITSEGKGDCSTVGANPEIQTAFGGLDDESNQMKVRRTKLQKCSLCKQEGHNRTKCRSSISNLYQFNDGGTGHETTANQDQNE